MIIAFTGKAGSGKSTAAKRLVEAHGFVRRRFASPLKDMLLALGLSNDEVDGAYKDEPCELLGGKTPRHAMQTLGTEWGRELIDPYLWTRAWVKSLPSDGSNVVVDDCRFPNEVEAIKKMGGMVVRIERRSNFVQDQGHISEQHKLTVDSVIGNHGSLASLYETIDLLPEGGV